VISWIDLDGGIGGDGAKHRVMEMGWRWN